MTVTECLVEDLEEDDWFTKNGELYRITSIKNDGIHSDITAVNWNDQSISIKLHKLNKDEFVRLNQ